MFEGKENSAWTNKRNTSLRTAPLRRYPFDWREYQLRLSSNFTHLSRMWSQRILTTKQPTTGRFKVLWDQLPTRSEIFRPKIIAEESRKFQVRQCLRQELSHWNHFKDQRSRESIPRGERRCRPPESAGKTPDQQHREIGKSSGSFARFYEAGFSSSECCRI